MLVLIAGATGNIGLKLVDSLLRRGHSVRALARNPQRIPASTLAQLESVVQSTSYYDIAALDRACAGGVDAVVCAYSGIPELQLEGQLLLLRAAERNGIRRFLAASWNYDWTALQLGQSESYDPYISFRRHVEMSSSSVKPLYVLCGVLAEVFFSVPGHGDFSPGNHGVWDPETKSMEVWGSGEEKWQWTTEGDAAEFAAEIVTRDGAEDGGMWRVCSGSHSLTEIADTYQRVRGKSVERRTMGSVEELRKQAHAARARGSPSNFWDYIGYIYQLYTLDGTWTLKTLDNDKLSVVTTSLEDFIRNNESI